MAIILREAAKCKYDVMALGECMVRLAPSGHGRLEFAKTLEVDVGGGEFNMAYACARLGLKTGFLSKLPDNPIPQINPPPTPPAPPACPSTTSSSTPSTASAAKTALASTSPKSEPASAPASPCMTAA